jgi:5-formyltetrahydrofolate cyclo-ligase
LKKLLRKQALAERDRLSPDERKKKSSEIEERLFSLPEFRNARTVLFFASFRSEVETLPMVRRALADGKRVVLPKVRGSELELFEVHDVERDIAPGAWGIPEPRESRTARVEDIDLIVVPGAAFDDQGNRIGYGAGFYDKLLPLYRGRTVALAFELQMVSTVPAVSHDIPVQKIITEKRVIDASDR